MFGLRSKRGKLLAAVLPGICEELLFTACPRCRRLAPGRSVQEPRGALAWTDVRLGRRLLGDDAAGRNDDGGLPRLHQVAHFHPGELFEPHRFADLDRPRCIESRRAGVLRQSGSGQRQREQSDIASTHVEDLLKARMISCCLGD